MPKTPPVVASFRKNCEFLDSSSTDPAAIDPTPPSCALFATNDESSKEMVTAACKPADTAMTPPAADCGTDSAMAFCSTWFPAKAQAFISRATAPPEALKLTFRTAPIFAVLFENVEFVADKCK